VKNLKISVITTSFNSEKTIVNCIESVLTQTYKNIEFIITDGASTDSTQKLINVYGNRIQKFISEPDSGIYDGINKGIRIATGDYILILNSDDNLHDNMVLEDVSDFIQKVDFPMAIYGKVHAYEKETGYSFSDGRPAKLSDFLKRMNFCTPAAFVNKHAYEEVGLYNEKYSISSDYEWAIRLFKQYSDSRIIFYDRTVTDFYVGGTSNRYFKKAYSEIALIIRDNFPRNDYIRHLFYNKSLLIKMSLVLFLKNTVFIRLWRLLKQNYSNRVK